MTATGCGGPKIKWYPDYNQAQPVSQKDSRPMLLYFWDWLSRDRARVEFDLFSDPDVAAVMRRTVNVRLEQGWFRDMARRYDVRDTPTFILTDPEGVEQARLVGVPSAPDFIRWLQAGLSPAPASVPATQPNGQVASGSTAVPTPPAAAAAPSTQGAVEQP